MFVRDARQLGSRAARIADISEGTRSHSSRAENTHALMGRLSCFAIHQARIPARPCASSKPKSPPNTARINASSINIMAMLVGRAERP